MVLSRHKAHRAKSGVGRAVIEDLKALYRTRQVLDRNDILIEARKRHSTVSISQALEWDRQARNEAAAIELNPVARPVTGMPVRISKPTPIERKRSVEQRENDTITRAKHDAEHAKAVAEGPGVDNVQPNEVVKAKLWEATVTILEQIKALR